MLSVKFCSKIYLSGTSLRRIPGIAVPYLRHKVPGLSPGPGYMARAGVCRLTVSRFW